jgi:CheY-like chemotaxis protein
VLVVDDEPRLLQTYRLLLEAEHEVVLARGGAEALERIRTDRSFDLILCDLQMPGIDGPTVYEHLRELAPELCRRIVFSTGGVFQPRVRAFLAENELQVLEKPVRPERLFGVIAQASPRADLRPKAE